MCSWPPNGTRSGSSTMERGTLVERTAGTGLEALSGWWNSIAAGDFDEDGDLDYAVGNFGLNTKYHPGPGTRCGSFYGDFDGTGHPQIVEAKEMKDGRMAAGQGKELLPERHAVSAGEIPAPTISSPPPRCRKSTGAHSNQPNALK